MVTPVCVAPAGEVLGRYRPRQAQANPLYRLLQDNLEEYLARGDPDPAFHPALAEKAFRAFL